MQEKTIIAVGVSPYTRIIPALFLKRYAIYCVKSSSDVDLIRNYTTVYCLEERDEKTAAKVHSTGYLLKNFAFQSFLNSRKYPYRLMFYQTTQKVVDTLEEQGIEWIGNRPASFSEVLLKGSFRDLLKKRGLPCLPDWRVPRNEFLNMTFDDLWNKWQRTCVVQRADFDVAGEMGTFFISKKEDFDTMYKILSKDDRYTILTISPFIDCHSLSMLGCVMPQGVLTSTLQLQLIDVPESLHGQLPTGVFLGHDWAFAPWPAATEKIAQTVVESLGAYLAGRGYKGIFGIDFIYDKKSHDLYPIECNPRFTGALPLYSLMNTATGVPPLDFFHIAAHLNIDVPMDFFKMNAALKKRKPLSHISLTPKGVYEMKINLPAGIYSYNPNALDEVRYERPGLWLSDFQDPAREFMLIDTVPHVGGRVIQNVQRLCKLIFPRGIATGSTSIDSTIGQLVTGLSLALRQDQETTSRLGDLPEEEIGE